MRQPRSLISIDQLTDDELHGLVERGVHYGRGGTNARPLEGRIVGIYFRNTSTRTRTAFSSGALRLGAQIISYGPDDLQVKTGESIEDTARVFGEMLDVLVIRSARSADEAASLAAAGSLSVVNAMSATEHPTQALADLTTIAERFGRLSDLRVLYVGEGNNTAIALALALPRLKAVHVEFRTPAGYGLPSDVLVRAAEAAQRTNSTVVEQHHMADLPLDVDVIYTTRWQTTGTSKPDADWRTRFAPFQVTGELWRESPGAVFMHDLPAHRGDEVTAQVLDGPRSIAFQQARNKLYSAMAVLEWAGRDDASTTYMDGFGGSDV